MGWLLNLLETSTFENSFKAHQFQLKCSHRDTRLYPDPQIHMYIKVHFKYSTFDIISIQ